jgi:hypothetical protein
MTNLKSHRNVLFLFLFALAVSINGQELVPADPYIIVRPAEPVADKDTVVLKLIIGTAQNSCVVPEIKDIRFTIEQANIAVYPPVYSVYLNYQVLELPKDKVCPAVYSPVEYGPEYNLGTLSVGTYEVYDNSSGIMTLDPKKPVYPHVGSFSVVNGSGVPIRRYSVQGKVVDDPSPLKRASLPIEGVKVLLRKSELANMDQLLLDPSISLAPPSVIDSAYTDSNGNFFFPKLLPDLYSIECLHPNYNPAGVFFNLASDTSFQIMMLEKSSTVSVSGHVRELFNAELVSLEGCTITVTKPQIVFPIEDAGQLISIPIRPIDPVVYKVVSGSDGSYKITGISLSANNEAWYVRATKRGYNEESKTVRLSVGSDQVVDFVLQKRYANFIKDTVDGIIITLSTEKEAYNVGEGVNIRYSLTNTTSRDITFGGFSANCEYDMAIGAKDADLPYYKLSDFVTCLRSISEIVVPAKDSVVKSFPQYVIPEDLVKSDEYQPWYVEAGLNKDEYKETWIRLGFRVREIPVSSRPVSSVKKGRSVECSLIRETLSLNLSEREFVRVTAHSLDGRIIPQLTFQKQLGAGSHVIPLDISGVRGICLLRVSGEKFTRAFKLNLAAR